MKLYVDEIDSSSVRSELTTTPSLATSALAYVEARAAFTRKRREGGLTSAEYRAIVASLERDWPVYFRIRVTEALLREAAGLAENHRLRVYDAVHLASAKLLREETGDTVVFASWDTHLTAAARREGFEPLQIRRR